MKNQRRVIMIMSKSAWPEGRNGEHEDQDWVLVVKKAIEIYRESVSAGIPAVMVAVTGFKNKSSAFSEIHYYREELMRRGFEDGEGVEFLSQGIDTTTQLLAAYRFAKAHNACMYVVSTQLHFVRVSWITWWDKVKGLHDLDIKHFVPDRVGIPRKEEIKNDLILMFLFIIIDILGLRSQFLAYVEKRRATGKL